MTFPRVVEFALTKDQVLSSNQRKHRMAAAKVTAHLRELAKTSARGVEPMKRAHLTVHIGWPDRRRRDAPNIWPTLKALIDGCVDAGVLPDDDDKHLVGPDLRPHHRGEKGVVHLRFEFVPRSRVPSLTVAERERLTASRDSAPFAQYVPEKGKPRLT